MSFIEYVGTVTVDAKYGYSVAIYSCGICGSWVLDDAKHELHHRNEGEL